MLNVVRLRHESKTQFQPNLCAGQSQKRGKTENCRYSCFRACADHWGERSAEIVARKLNDASEKKDSSVEGISKSALQLYFLELGFPSYRIPEEVPWGFRGGRGSILTACRKVEQKRRRSMGFMAFDILEGRRPLVACVRRTRQAGLESCHAAAEQSDGSGPPPAACGGEGHFAQRSRLCR